MYLSLLSDAFEMLSWEQWLRVDPSIFTKKLQNADSKQIWTLIPNGITHLTYEHNGKPKESGLACIVLGRLCVDNHP